MRAGSSVALIVGVAVGVATPGLAQPIEDPLPDIPLGAYAVRLVPIAAGLDYPATPTDLAHTHDGSGTLFVAGLGGHVTRIDPDGSTSLFLDTTNPDTLVVPTNFGMTCVAVHPGFDDPQSAGHRRFYTITTEAPGASPHDFGYGNNHQDVITEWRTFPESPHTVDPASAREVLRVQQPHRDHNVTDIAFTLDGLMLVSVGDGGNNAPGSTGFSDNAQDTSNIFGTLLRIDPLGLVGTPSANGRYSIPADNPFVGVAGEDEIFAYGLRSPYRVTVDRATGEVYVGNVGQSTIEEIEHVTPGGNYGWNRKEGSFLFDPDTRDVYADLNPDPALTDPLAEYDHDDGSSVVCGHVYRGSGLPYLRGRIVLGDYYALRTHSSRLFHADAATGELAEFVIDPGGAAIPGLTLSIGEDERGELYVLGAALDGTNGVVLRITNPCPADFDGTGSANGIDVGLFLNAYAMLDPAADLNDDNAINGIDVGLFLSAYAGGC